jgi:hypothetical protein
MTLEEIIETYRSDEFLSEERLLQMQRYLIGHQFDYTSINIQAFNDFNAVVFRRGYKETGGRVAISTAETEAHEKHPELNESEQILNVIKSTLISIQNQLNRA